MKSIREARKTIGIVSWIAMSVVCLGFYVSPEYPIDSPQVRIAAGLIVLSLFALLAILMINLPRTPFFRQQIDTMAVQMMSGRLVAQAVIEAKEKLPQAIMETVRAEWEKLGKDLPTIISTQISIQMQSKFRELSEQLRLEMVRVEGSLIADFQELLAERVKVEMQKYFRTLHKLEERLAKARESRAAANGKVQELKALSTNNGHSPEHYAAAIETARKERATAEQIVQDLKRQIAQIRGIDPSDSALTTNLGS
jgi:hypothetical protein